MPDYRSDAGLLSHLQIQKQNIEQYKSEAAADAGDIQEINDDCNNMAFIIEFCQLADEYKTTAFGVKNKLIRGELGETVGNLMTAPENTPPSPLVSGIEKRARERDGRFKRAKTMTEAAMLALDLNDNTSGIAPETVKPTLEVFPAQNNYDCAIVVGKRGKSDMWKLLGRKMNNEKWLEIASGTGKSGNFHLNVEVEGQPERIELKIQLYKSNEPYGQQSDPTYATLNP